MKTSAGAVQDALFYDIVMDKLAPNRVPVFPTMTKEGKPKYPRKS